MCSGKSAGTKVVCGKCPSGDETRAARAFDLHTNPKKICSGSQTLPQRIKIGLLNEVKIGQQELGMQTNTSSISSHRRSQLFAWGEALHQILSPPFPNSYIYSYSFHIYLKFLISIKPAEIKDSEQVKSQIEQHQDHHLQFGIFNNYNISFEHVHFEQSCKANFDKFDNNMMVL